MFYNNETNPKTNLIDPQWHLMKQILCSYGSWIDEISAVLK